MKLFLQIMADIASPLSIFVAVTIKMPQILLVRLVLLHLNVLNFVTYTEIKIMP